MLVVAAAVGAALGCYFGLGDIYGSESPGVSACSLLGARSLSSGDTCTNLVKGVQR